jgi:hypothetical protein
VDSLPDDHTLAQGGMLSTRPLSLRW